MQEQNNAESQSSIEEMAGKSASSADPTQSPASSISAFEATSETCKKKTPGFSKMDKFVTILVKNSLTSKKFMVHKGFAVHYSPVFKSAFNSNFKEGQTQTYELEDTTEGAVQLLVEWIYTQKLDLNGLEEEIKWSAQSLCLANLWVLADKLLIHPLQNAALDELEALCARCNMIPCTILNYVYNNTQEGSQLRRFLIHRCALKLKPSWFTLPEKFPKEMLLELAAYLGEVMDKSKFPRFKISDYEVPEP